MRREPEIAEYGLLGDGRSAALVSREGSIDWLCWPRFDSPPVFGALVDPERGGAWSLGPTGPAEITRRYLDESALIETRFRTATGLVRLTDLMLAADEEEKRRLILPDHEVLRRVECLEGEVEVEMRFEPRVDFGRVRLRVRPAGPLGLRFEWSGGLLILRAEGPVLVAGQSARLRTRLSAGRSLSFSLTFTREAPAAVVPFGERVDRAIERARRYWVGWAGRARYEGPFRAAVVRSAITLKLLQYAPSGAIVAAPTSSLPERIGGALNWDYRFCWLRDASLTARALYGIGYPDEADAFVSWLIHATRLTRPRLVVLYDPFGRRPPDERERAELAGHRGSRPVRIGNAARDQLQLDIYGEVIEAAARATSGGERLDRETSTLLCGLANYLCDHWQDPDEGIWEPRSGRSRHTHSLVLAWAGLDRLLGMCACGAVGRAPHPRFAETREKIRATVEERAWNEALGAYAGTLGGDRLDAAVLLLPYHGFCDAASPRMASTFARIRERLGAGRHLYYRYLSEHGPTEGAFAICSFWAIELMALGAAPLDDAYAAFAELLRFANDLGLYGEEIDPSTGGALGNFPQAFTHVGLISAALALEERAARERRRKPVREEARLEVR